MRWGSPLTPALVLCALYHQRAQNIPSALINRHWATGFTVDVDVHKMPFRCGNICIITEQSHLIVHRRPAQFCYPKSHGDYIRKCQFTEILAAGLYHQKYRFAVV